MAVQPQPEPLSTVDFSDTEEEPMDDTVTDFGGDFDVERISSLAGIQENMLPDFSLDEDSVASNANKEPDEFGPYNTEHECIISAQHETNGVEGENFVVIPKGAKFYWKRTIDETVEPVVVNDDGIRNSVHNFTGKKSGTAKGDNPLADHEADELEESVEDIYESLNLKYKKFLEEK